MQAVSRIHIATRLTYASLAPLFFIPLFIAYSKISGADIMHPTDLVVIFQSYLAIILSFVGGINWGTALRAHDSAETNRIFIWSVICPLAGWITLLVPPSPFTLAFYAVLFSAQGYLDRKNFSQGLFEEWFLKLRKTSTVGVIAAVVMMIVIAS